MRCPILLLAVASLASAQEASVVAPRPYLEGARAAARWLESVAIGTPDGVTWAPTPAASRRVPDPPGLYSGSPGPILFLLELESAEPDSRQAEERWGKLARAGADELLAHAAEPVRGAGFYTGAAGRAFALIEAWRVTGDGRYRAGAALVLDGLHAVAQREGERASFGPVTDVIAGDAGVGFLLLYSGQVLERPSDLALAAALGRSLAGRADKVDEAGLDWPMTPTYARRMPNYSHGTAGVAAFLAALGSVTGDDALLDAARAGTQHVLGVADRSGEGLLVPHHLPGGEDLFYLGWCHGPVGTSRLFLTLARVTQEESWLELAEAGGRALLAYDLPRGRTRGYWNNVGRCCGAAGIVEFLLDRRAHRGTGTDAEGDLALARALADDVLRRATTAEHDGEVTLAWEQAEHRVRPDWLEAQTGWMQGAAGIGWTLLYLDAALRGETPRIRMPEDHAWGAPRAHKSDSHH
ncbi:MAG: hypothetical protein GY711_01805 [bacterium]|nr:hypothetical protein [bacterium]